MNREGGRQAAAGASPFPTLRRLEKLAAGSESRRCVKTGDLLSLRGKI